MHEDTVQRSLADLATAVWRLANKLADGPHDRQVHAVIEALTGLGVEARRYDDVPFDSGLKLEVLAVQPTEGLDREVVIETVRPAVYLHGELIQRGEVIVGTPEPDDDTTRKDDES